MTAATLSRLPLMAGGTLLDSLGRGGFWTATRLIDFGFWGAGQFMRAPIAVSAVVAVVGLSAIAGANALYFQHERHPAPLFYSPPKAAVVPPRVVPVLPAPRPRLPLAGDSDVTGSIARQAAQPTTAGDIKALQARLIALGLLDGDADGIYGPRTAVALRVFESRHGLRPDGRLTPVVLAAVANATLPPSVAPAAVIAAPTPTQQAGLVSPVPLAPLPTASAMTVAPVAQSAASMTAPPLAPAPATPAAPLAVAAAPAATIAPAAANTFAANSSTDGGGPAANAAAAAPGSSLAAREDVTPPAVRAPGDPAATASANLTPAQRLAAQFGTLPPAATAAEAMPTVATVDDSQGSTDPALITEIQKGLASLGFLADKIDGVPGEGTAKAIRNFQVFYNYKVTGLATHQLLGLLVQHGAAM